MLCVRADANRLSCQNRQVIRLDSVALSKSENLPHVSSCVILCLRSSGNVWVPEPLSPQRCDR